MFVWCVYTLLAPAYFLQNFLAGVGITKECKAVSKDFKETKRMQKLIVSTRPEDSLALSETISQCKIPRAVLKIKID